MNQNRGGKRPPAKMVAALAAPVLGVTLSLATAPAAHAADTYFCADGTQPYASVATVEAFSAGTAVKGLSVTKGTTPTEFTGKYIGYIDDGIDSGVDMLLFRMSSDVIDGTGDLKAAGIWAGMSGSPVYTSDGKLIGAVAYSLNYDNLPVAGVTPAEYMKAIGTTPIESAATVKATASNLEVAKGGAKIAGTDLTGRSFSEVKAVQVAGPAGKKANEFTNRTLARTPKNAPAADFFRSGHFMPAAAQSSSVSQPLVPGGNIAALYSSGDLVLGGVGTVTAVCGDKVYAFGHPMSFLGKTSAAMANASAAMVVPDGTGWYGSYKQVSTFGEPLGMITQDRLVGIQGTTGSVKSFPVEVKVSNSAGKAVKTYRANVALPSAAANAAAALTGHAAYLNLDSYNNGAAQVTWKINYTRQNGKTGTYKNSQYVSDPAAWFPDDVASYPGQDVYSFLSNTSEDVKITGVSVSLKLLSEDCLTYRPSDMQLKNNSGAWVSLSEATLKAGKSYTVRPVFKEISNTKPTGKTITGDSVKFKLSKKARNAGSISLTPAKDVESTCDGDDCEEWDGSTADFDDLLDTLKSAPKNNYLVGELEYDKKGKGSGSGSFNWKLNGVVAGSTSVDFSIKK